MTVVIDRTLWMPDVTVASDASSDTQAYVRFTRRVQAVLVDTIIFMIVLAGALAVAVAFASDNIARIVGFTVAVGVFDRRHDWPLPF
jgi:hypothetical protein